MPSPNNSSPGNSPVNAPVPNTPPKSADEISLGELVTAILQFYVRFGRLIFGLALLGALAAAIAVSQAPRYAVTAIMDTPQLSLDEWRGLTPLLSDSRLVEASLAATGDARDNIASRFLKPDFWDRKVQYRSALRRDDLKDSPNVDLKNASTLGLEVSITARDADDAAWQLEAIGNHLRQTLLWRGLQKYLQDLRIQVGQERAKLEIRLIQSQFGIEQNSQRVAEMRKLLETYPELRSMDVGTLVSVEGQGGRYMSPLAQIVALEATISELRADMRAAQRDREKLGWDEKFLDTVADDAKTIFLGSALAAKLQEHHAALEAATAQSSAAREVSHELDLAIESQRTRAELWRFKSIPTVLQTLVQSRRPLPVGVLVFAGLSIGLSVLLALYTAVRRLRQSTTQPLRADV